MNPILKTLRLLLKARVKGHIRKLEDGRVIWIAEHEGGRPGRAATLAERTTLGKHKDGSHYLRATDADDAATILHHAHRLGIAPKKATREAEHLGQKGKYTHFHMTEAEAGRLHAALHGVQEAPEEVTRPNMLDMMDDEPQAAPETTEATPEPTVEPEAKPAEPAVPLPVVTNGDRYAKRVSENLKHMGTPPYEWTVCPISGMKEVDTGNGKTRVMPEYQIPSGYNRAPSLFEKDGECCQLCGTPIKNVHHLQHDGKKWTLMVGSECVTHFTEGESGDDLVKKHIDQQNQDAFKQAVDARDAIFAAFHSHAGKYADLGTDEAAKHRMRGWATQGQAGWIDKHPTWRDAYKIHRGLHRLISDSKGNALSQTPSNMTRWAKEKGNEAANLVLLANAVLDSVKAKDRNEPAAPENIETKPEPVEGFHGTHVWDGYEQGRDIQQFDRNYTTRDGRRKPGIDNVGIWFSSIHGDKTKGAAMYAGEKGIVYRAHLDIKKPWITTFDKMAEKAWELNGKPELKPGQSKAFNQNPENLRAWLKSEGYDGIKIVHGENDREFKDQDAWVALEPEQVKILGKGPAVPDEGPKVGDTKVEDGVTYRLNENHRWERVDEPKAEVAPEPTPEPEPATTPEPEPEAPKAEEAKPESPVTIEKVGDVYVARFKFDYAVKDAVKAAGFRFDGASKQWWTKDPLVAAKFQGEEVAAAAVEEHNRKEKERAEKDQASIEASRASDADIQIPAPEGLNYLPYQKAGIAFASDRPGVLIADEMGLGKTIQAIGISNNDESIRKVLIICPASLKLNWKREWEKWDTKGLKVGIAEGSDFPEDADVVVMNYDIASKLKDKVKSQDWDMIVGDEAHYLKNPKAQRTEAILGKNGKGGFTAKRRVFLSGTPIVNRPKELWPLVQALDPEGLGKNFFAFMKRYTNASHNGYGWDFTGSSNLPELQTKLRASIMVRRLKKDVLKDLPPKRRSIIAIQPTGAQAKAVQEESAAAERTASALEALQARVELAKADEDPAVYDAAVKALQEGVGHAFTEMSKARKDVAIAKIPAVVDQVNDLLEQTDKVVIMAHHHEVVDALMEQFPGAVKIDGRMDGTSRQSSVDKFQNDPDTKVFIGSIKAAGVGITLTASHTVVFAELDWVPGNISQAEDRCHRIGQHDSVDVFHVVLDGSIDARMAKTLTDKQAVLDSALDKGEVQAEAANTVDGVEQVHVEPQARVDQTEDVAQAVTRSPAATKDTTRDKLTEIAATLTPEQIQHIHTALQTLAGMDEDYAAERNERGYNGTDSRIGHSLANSGSLSPRMAALGSIILKKYHRQISEDTYRAIFGSHPSDEKPAKKSRAKKGEAKAAEPAPRVAPQDVPEANFGNTEEGPAEGETNEAGLTFHNSRWHRDKNDPRPLTFASGTNEPGYIHGFADAGIPVGVSLEHMDEKHLDHLVAVAHKGVPIFVDNGAFSEMEFGPNGPQVVNPISDQEWDRRLGVYERLAEQVGPALTAVAPDRVGDQRVTLERLKKYSGRVQAIRNHGARILLPVQKGQMDQAEFYAAGSQALGFAPTPALPMKKNATTPQEAVEFVTRVQPKDIHLLGLGLTNKEAEGLIAKIRAARPGINITMDSNMITANVGRKRSLGKITGAQDELKAETAFNGELGEKELGNMIDYTDSISQPSTWATGAALKRIAESVGLDKEQTKAFMADPDEFLQEEHNGEAKWWEHPDMDAALDREWNAFASDTASQSRKRDSIPMALGDHKTANQIEPQTPKEGDERVVNGQTYRLHNGRWHRVGETGLERMVDGKWTPIDQPAQAPAPATAAEAAPLPKGVRSIEDFAAGKTKATLASGHQVMGLDGRVWDVGFDNSGGIPAWIASNDEAPGIWRIGYNREEAARGLRQLTDPNGLPAGGREAWPTANMPNDTAKKFAEWRKGQQTAQEPAAGPVSAPEPEPAPTAEPAIQAAKAKLREMIAQKGGKQRVAEAVIRTRQAGGDGKQKAEHFVDTMAENLGLEREDVLDELGIRQSTRTVTTGKPAAEPKPTAPEDDVLDADGLSDDPNSPNYRYRDTGYISGSRKESAALRLKEMAREGRVVTTRDVNWTLLEENPREAKELIVKSNVFGEVDWTALQEAGMEPGTGFLVNKVYASIPSAPEDSAEARKNYVAAVSTLRERLEATKTVDELMATLNDIGAEAQGTMMNMEQQAKWNELNSAYQTVREPELAYKAHLQEAQNTQTRLTGVFHLAAAKARRFKNPNNIPQDIKDEIAAAKAALDEAYAETERRMQRDQFVEANVGGLTLKLHPLEAAAKKARSALYQFELRCRAENANQPMAKIWETMGKQFKEIVTRRNETFRDHYVSVKNGKVQDWSWNERKSAAPKANKKESVRFQLAVADRFERTGGKPVAVNSTEALKAAFNLRDIDCGNYVLRDPVSAKFHIEQAAGAMSDLSEVLGLPPETVSMKGRLAIGFGARGMGARTGLAHYSPVHRVINITKEKGGGHLAHEWFHAMDNLVCEAVTGKGIAEAMGTEGHIHSTPEGKAFQELVSAMTTGEHRNEEVINWTDYHEKMAARIRDLKAKVGGSTRDSHYYQREALIFNSANLQEAHDKLDQFFREYAGKRREYAESRKKSKGAITKEQNEIWATAREYKQAAAAYFGDGKTREVRVNVGKPSSRFYLDAQGMDAEEGRDPLNLYWSTPAEMAARCFAGFVEDKLAAQGRKSDYLTCKTHNHFYQDSRPYPEAEERERINAAMEKLFETLKSTRAIHKALAQEPAVESLVYTPETFLESLKAIQAQYPEIMAEEAKAEESAEDRAIQKSQVHAHTRTVNGKVVQVHEYTDSRKAAMTATRTAHAHSDHAMANDSADNHRKAAEMHRAAAHSHRLAHEKTDDAELHGDHKNLMDHHAAAAIYHDSRANDHGNEPEHAMARPVSKSIHENAVLGCATRLFQAKSAKHNLGKALADLPEMEEFRTTLKAATEAGCSSDRLRMLAKSAGFDLASMPATSQPAMDDEMASATM